MVHVAVLQQREHHIPTQMRLAEYMACYVKVIFLDREFLNCPFVVKNRLNQKKLMFE